MKCEARELDDDVACQPNVNSNAAKNAFPIEQ